MRSTKMLGEMLIESGLLTPAQLDQTLARQQSTGQKLGRMLVSAGIIREEQLLDALSRQLQIAIAPEARLRQVKPPRQALRMVPGDMARRYRILPIYLDERDQSLSVVMADPTDLTSLTLIKEQNAIARLRVLLGSERLLDELISQHYEVEGGGGDLPRPDARIDAHRPDASRNEIPRIEAPWSDNPRPESRIEIPRPEIPRLDARPEPRADHSRANQARADRSDSHRPDRMDPRRADRSGSHRHESSDVQRMNRTEPARPASRQEPARQEARTDSARPEARHEQRRGETSRPDIPRLDPSLINGESPRRPTEVRGGTPSRPEPTVTRVEPQRGAMPPLVLLEPDDRHAQALASWFGLEGHSILRAKDLPALERIAQRTPEALILLRSAAEDAATTRALSAFPPERVRPLPSAWELVEHATGVDRFIEFYLKTLDFFFSLLEDDKEAPSQRHLRQVSRLSSSVAQRLGLPSHQVDALAVAGYAYQLGDYLSKRGVFAQGTEGGDPFAMTADLWASFGPPLPIVPLIQGLSKDAEAVGELPLEVAILRAVSVYVEMRDGSRLYSKVGHDKAMRHLQDHRGTKFDPRVIDALQDTLAKEQLIGQLEGSGTAGLEVLLVDKDKLSQEVLELRLVREGFRVRTAKTGEEALKLIDAQRPHLLISEITLPRLDGFELCSRLKADPATHDIPFFFLSGRTDTFHVTKGLELGADDFLTKPVNMDILISKVRRLERAITAQAQAAPTGVQGSLSEMGLFDLLQVLQMGMKTARVSLARGSQRCELYLDQGRLVYAAVGDRRGQDAFFDLCTWDSGTFAVSPGLAAPERNLHESNDFLLMEGMRRADELSAGISQLGKG